MTKHPPPLQGREEKEPKIVSESSLVTVKPVRPVAPYFGGKRLLAKRLIPMIEAIDHDLYGEAFIGMGGIFFRRPHRPKVEVINDMSRDVWTLFMILREHFQQFLDVLKWQISSREEFERLLKLNPEALTDLQRAARFLYLQRMTFGGKVVGRTFGGSRTTPARFDLLKLVPMLEDAHERLSGVVIERLPWADFVSRYDRPGALFYLDPPYYGCEAEYGPQFDREQLLSMPDVLRRLKGRWILSINDHPDIRRVFSGCDIQEVLVRYTAAGAGKGRDFPELIISG